jgi:folate-binding protein YgfZ
LGLGVPEADDFGSDKMFALDADLDELHAIDFDKGCYVGQELTARMKHRGTARKRLLAVESAGQGALVPGTELRANGHAIGEITSAHGPRGFALVRLDRMAEANGAPVDADGAPVVVTIQDWLKA